MTTAYQTPADLFTESILGQPAMLNHNKSPTNISNNDCFIPWLYSNKWRTHTGTEPEVIAHAQGKTILPWIHKPDILTNEQRAGTSERQPPRWNVPLSPVWRSLQPRYISALGRGAATWASSGTHDDNDPGRLRETTQLYVSSPEPQKYRM